MEKIINKLIELLELCQKYRGSIQHLDIYEKPFSSPRALSLSEKMVGLYAEVDDFIIRHSQYKDRSVFTEMYGVLGNIYQVAFGNYEVYFVLPQLENVITDLNFIISKSRNTKNLDLGKNEVSNKTSNIDFWILIHPDIMKVAKSRFESGHYADAVEASFKEINIIIKEIYKKRCNKNDDGSSLMNNVFSPRNPIIRLGDLNTDDGKNIQTGYMQMFAGSMTGIRNPKAHSNLVLSKERCIHFLFLASLLRNKIDEELQ